LLFGEQQVPAAGATVLCQFDHLAHQLPCHCRLVCALGKADARAGGGGEGNGAEQLWVVLEAVAAVGVGPGPVEHIFAPGVGFQVEGHKGQVAAIAVDVEVVGRPAAGGADTAAVFESGEKFRAQKGVIQRIGRRPGQASHARVPCL